MCACSDNSCPYVHFMHGFGTTVIQETDGEASCDVGWSGADAFSLVRVRAVRQRLAPRDRRPGCGTAGCAPSYFLR